MALSQSVSMNDLLVLLLHCYPGPVRRVSRWSAQSVVRVLASRGVGRTSASSAARVLTPFAVLSSCRARTRATASRCIALPSPSYEADLINEISFTWGKAVKKLVYWSDDISRTTASLNLYPGGIESQRKLLLCEVHGGFQVSMLYLGTGVSGSQCFSRCVSDEDCAYLNNRCELGVRFFLKMQP